MLHLNSLYNKLYEPLHEKTSFFAYAKIKVQISCTVTAQMICAFVFATYIVQGWSPYFLNPKFQASRAMLKNMFVWHCRPRGSAVDRLIGFFFITKSKQMFLLQIHSKCKFFKQKPPRENSDNTVFLRIAC